MYPGNASAGCDGATANLAAMTFLESSAVQRAFKALLLAVVSLYFGLVALGNLTAWGINYPFVGHVMAMDTVFPGNPLTWRAIHDPLLWRVSYALLIAWECAAFLFTALAAWRFAGAVRRPEAEPAARRLACNALVFGLLLWLGAFITIGGEWFQMWQSREWNGVDAALRNFACQALVLLYVNQPTE